METVDEDEVAINFEDKNRSRSSSEDSANTDDKTPIDSPQSSISIPSVPVKRSVPQLNVVGTDGAVTHLDEADEAGKGGEGIIVTDGIGVFKKNNK